MEQEFEVIQAKLTWRNVIGGAVVVGVAGGIITGVWTVVHKNMVRTFTAKEKAQPQVIVNASSLPLPGEAIISLPGVGDAIQNIQAKTQPEAV